MPRQDPIAALKADLYAARRNLFRRLAALAAALAVETLSEAADIEAAKLAGALEQFDHELAAAISKLAGRSAS